MDSTGRAVVTGSTQSPTSRPRGPVQAALGGYIDGFVTLLAAADGALVWSTFLGAATPTGPTPSRSARAPSRPTAETLSPAFPTASPIQAELQDEDYDAFLVTFGG